MSEPIRHPAEATLHLYLDGELSSAEQMTFETHLSGCLRCQNQLTELRTLFHAIQEAPQFPLERDLSALVVAALEQPTAVAANLRWLLSLQLAIAIMALALFGALNFSSPLPAFDFSLAQETLGQGLADYLAEFSAGWEQWLDAFSLYLNEKTSPLDKFPFPAFSNIAILATLLGGGVLWFAANRMLLPIKMENRQM